MLKLSDVIGDVVAVSSKKQDFETTLGDFVNGLRQADKDSWVIEAPDDTLVLTKAGFKQLAKDRLNCTPSILNDNDVSEATKMAYLRDKAQRVGNKPIVVRQTNNKIDSILTDHYVLFDNTKLMLTLAEFTEQKVLPPLDDLYAHSFFMDDDARDVFVRIIAPDHWNHRNGEDFYSGISFRNNEMGKGGLQINPAIARVACFNYSLAENVIYEPHRWTTFDDMQHAMKRGVDHIQTFASEFFERIQHSKGVEFDDPKAVFELIAKRLRLPSKVKEATYNYWDREGEGHSAFDILQAVTFGCQKMTNVKGRAKPKWDVRTEIEQNMWQLTDEFVGLHQGGEDVNEFVSNAELISKSKAVQAVAEWQEAKDAVSTIEAVDYR